jgi:hypothetical protein
VVEGATAGEHAGTAESERHGEGNEVAHGVGQESEEDVENEADEEEDEDEYAGKSIFYGMYSDFNTAYAETKLTKKEPLYLMFDFNEHGRIGRVVEITKNAQV